MTASPSLSLVVTAAALGAHMKCYGPRSALRVGGRSVLKGQAGVVREAYPDAEVVVVVGEYRDRTAELARLAVPGCTVVANDRYLRTGAAYSAQLGVASSTGDRVVVVPGDVLYSREIGAAVNPSGSWVVAEPAARRPLEVGVNEARGWAASLQYGTPLVWSQCVVMDRVERDLFTSLRLGPEYMHEAVEAVIERGGRFGVARPSGLVTHEIDRPQDLAAAKEFARFHWRGLK